MSLDLSAALISRFKPLEKDTSPGVVIEFTGLPGTGKTDLALRAPGPLVHFGFDYHGANRCINRLIAAYPEKAKGIYSKTYAVKPRDRKVGDDEAASKEMRETVILPFLEDYEAAIKGGMRSFVIDTLDLMKQSQVISKWGKMESNSQLGYTEINAETARLVHMAREADVVLCLITRMKEEYKETRVGDKLVSKATGKFVKSSNVAVTHAVDAWIETFTEGKDFKVRIMDAKTNKVANGTVFNSPEFHDVAMALKPEVNPDVW
jgi:hypothetical protein